MDAEDAGGDPLDDEVADGVAEAVTIPEGETGTWDPSSGTTGGTVGAAGTAPTDEDIPCAGWRACGVSDSRYKHARDYVRIRIHSRMVGSIGRLYCGRYDSVPGGELTFGYRHIKQRHTRDFALKSQWISRNWRDLAGWTINWTLRDPDVAGDPTPRRFCYQRKFYLYYGDTLVAKMRTYVYLGKTGMRIMTAFPGSGVGGKGKCKAEIINRGGTVRYDTGR